MASYDPQIIQKFADRLYARSAGAIVISAFLGVVIGFALNPFLIGWLPAGLANWLPEWTWAAVFGVLGFLQGMERAALFKLQAQTALCQMQIERNTRPTNPE